MGDRASRRRRHALGPLTRERETLEMACELLIVLTSRSAAAGGHALGAAGAGEGLVARGHLRGVVDGGGVRDGLTLVRVPDGLGQDVRIHHRMGEMGRVSRRMVVAEHGVDPGRGRGGRDGEMLGGLEGDAEQLTGLLLLEGAHLILEHLALEGALALMFHTLEGALIFAGQTGG